MGLALLMSHLVAKAGITVVQTAGSTSDAGSSFISQAFNLSNTAGNTIVLAVSWGDIPAPSISASDTLGNTYSVATNDFDPGNRQGLAILHATIIQSGANTVTVSLVQVEGAVVGYRRIIVSEYSGITIPTPLDVTAKNQANGNTLTDGITSTAATTTVNGDLIFGAVMDDSGAFGTITAGTGFIQRASLNNMDMAIQDMVQTIAGPVSSTFTFSLPDRYLAQMATFKAAVTGAGPPQLNSVACNATRLAQNTTSICTVLLTQIAPTSGSTVSLSSSSTALIVPASVTVLAGSVSATFPASTASISTPQTVVLTATLSGVSKTTNLILLSDNPSFIGRWSGPFGWPLVAVHMTLLPTGQVLMWDSDVGSAKLWDPATAAFTDVSSTLATNAFCSSHTTLSDGKVLVDGGHIDFDMGSRDVNIFDPTTQSWSLAQPMAFGRWYPTAITLADGRVLAVSGHTTCSTCVADVPEVYDPAANNWAQLPQARLAVPTQYPHLFVLPDGRVILAGSSEEIVDTRVLDMASQTWTIVDAMPVNGGSSVMYAPGQIMKSGGAWDDGVGTPVASTYVLDMTRPSPVWRSTAAMAFARVTDNLVVLPDGTVLVIGGTSSADMTLSTAVVYEAEMWSPSTESWTTMASMKTPRLYHSTALLLPDGRVVTGGSGRYVHQDQFNAEIYAPPYLFKGPRPVMTSAPSSIAYGSNFSVSTPDASRVATVSLVRLGSTTHSFNTSQRFLKLTSQQSIGGLVVQAPVSRNLAPPGYYMLFIIDTNGVPSVGSFVRIP